MTMQHHDRHPDDERLAAFADGTTVAAADRDLAAHLTDCPRCAAMVDDLRHVQASLAELPDLVPSRPLRFLPPVAARSDLRAATLARRLFGPVLVAGIALSVVGGAGGLATIVSMGASGAAVPARQLAPGEERGQPAAAPSAAASAATSRDDVVTDSGASAPADGGINMFSAQSPSQGSTLLLWPVLLVAGLLLIGAALLLRFVRSPRAG
jgi:anti-sigma factor RsiW